MDSAVTPDMEVWQWVLQGGSTAALLLFLFGFKAGWWATRQEVESVKERAKRAETQLDQLMPLVPLVSQLSTAVQKLAGHSP